jgi:hypothetical protein
MFLLTVDLVLIKYSDKIRVVSRGR